MQIAKNVTFIKHLDSVLFMGEKKENELTFSQF